MRRGLLGVGVVAIVVTIGAVTAATSSSAPAEATRAVDFKRDELVYKPRKFTPMDGYPVKRIHWQSWTSNKARGKGLVVGVKTKIKLFRPELCEPIDETVFSEVKLKSVGRPGDCAIICANGNPAYFFGC
jgi:hypothetical protein